MRAHQYLFKQQQQQQQILINTLKTLNIKQQQLAQLQSQINNNQASATTTLDKKKSSSSSCNKSPSTSSMRRNNSVGSSKRSRKSFKNNNSNTDVNNSLLQLQQQQQQQQKNYYLLPNSVRPSQQQTNVINQGTLLNRNVYNDVDLLALEAALNLNGGNLLLINNPYQPQQPFAAYMPNDFQQQQQQINLTSPNKLNELEQQKMMFMNIFENNKNSNVESNRDGYIYESSDMETNGLNEQEPMLTSHYASTGLLVNKHQQQKLSDKLLTSQETCKI